MLISCGIQNDFIFFPNWPKNNSNIYWRYFLSQTTTARPQTKLVLLESAADVLHSVSRVLKIMHLKYVNVHAHVCLGKAVCVCIRVWGRVNLQYVFMSHAHAGKMEKAFSFCQRIIGPRSHYEWLTHVR